MKDIEKLFVAFSEVPDEIIWEAETNLHRKEKYISRLISICMIVFGIIGEMTFFLKNTWLKAKVVKYVVNPINSTAGTMIMVFGGMLPVVIILVGIHRLRDRLYINHKNRQSYTRFHRKRTGTDSGRNWSRWLEAVMTVLLLFVVAGIPIRHAMAQDRLPTVEEWIWEYFMFSGDSGGIDDNNITNRNGSVMTDMSVEVNKITDADITEFLTCSGIVTVAGADWTFTFDYAFRGPEIIIEETGGVADTVEVYGNDKTKAILWARISEPGKSSFLECFLVDLQTGKTEAIADQEQEQVLYEKTIYIESTEGTEYTEDTEDIEGIEYTEDTEDISEDTKYIDGMEDIKYISEDTEEDIEVKEEDASLSGNSETEEEKEMAWKHFCYDPIFSPDKTKVIYHSNTELMLEAEDGSDVTKEELDAGDLWYLRDLTTGETRKLTELAPELHTNEIYFIDDDTIASYTLEETDPSLNEQGLSEKQIPLAYSWSEDTWTRYDIDCENLIGNSFIVKTMKEDIAEYKDLWSGQVTSHEESGEQFCYGNRDVIVLFTEENGLEFYFPRLVKWMKCDMQFQSGETICGISSYGENVFLLTTEDEDGDSYEYEIVMTGNES